MPPFLTEHLPTPGQWHDSLKEYRFQGSKHLHYVAHSPAFWLSVGAVVARKVSRLLKRRTPANCVLELDLDRTVLTPHRVSGIAQMMQPTSICLDDVLDALRLARDDSNVKGLIVRLGATPLPPSFCDELVAAVTAMRATGKVCVAYAESMGSYFNSTFLYFLASAFNAIYVAPCGTLQIGGLMLNAMFLRGAFDKLDAKVEFFKRENYKLAANMFTETKCTEAHQETNRDLSDSILNYMSAKIASQRGAALAAPKAAAPAAAAAAPAAAGAADAPAEVPAAAADAAPVADAEAAAAPVQNVSAETVRALIADGPYPASRALEKGLIDAIAWRDQVYEEHLPKALGVDSKDDLNLLFLSKYLAKKASVLNASKKYTIALVQCNGPIGQGDSKHAPFDDESIGADSVCAALRVATKDDAVKVILLRINSPGGDYFSSALIAREVVRAREAGKKVVASMGVVAASGGYFIACHADHILASPLTFTGSIGVVFGKINARNTYKKLGITWDGHTTDERSATLFSGLHSLSKEQKVMVEEEMDRVYADFMDHVQQGRGFESRQSVKEVAQGRVVMGERALASKLVDSLGGWDEALALCQTIAGEEFEGKLGLVEFPKEASLLTALSFAPANSDEKDHAPRASASPAVSLLGSAAASLGMGSSDWQRAMASSRASMWQMQALQFCGLGGAAAAAGSAAGAAGGLRGPELGAVKTMFKALAFAGVGKQASSTLCLAMDLPLLAWQF